MCNSKRQRKKKSFGPNFEVYLIEGTRDDLYSIIPYLYELEEDLITYCEVIASQDSNFWEKAINNEIVSIIGNNTLVLEDLPLRCKPIGCKWIF